MRVFSLFGTVNIVVIAVTTTACILAIKEPSFRAFFEKIVEWVIVGYFAQKIPQIKETMK